MGLRMQCGKCGGCGVPSYQYETVRLLQGVHHAVLLGLLVSLTPTADSVGTALEGKATEGVADQVPEQES